MPVANYDVSDFGVVADGSTDALAGVQAALDKAGADGGGTVTMGAGTYFLSNMLLVPSNVTLTGTGAGTVLLNPPGDLPGISVGGAYHFGTVGLIGVTNASVLNLAIDHQTNGTHANGVILASDGYGTRTTSSTVSGVTIQGNNDHEYLIWNFRGENNTIVNNTLYGHAPAGVASEEEGIEIYGGHNVMVANNTVVDIGSNALYAWEDDTPGSATDLGGIQFLNNTVTGGAIGIHVSVTTASTGITISGNTVSGQSANGVYVATDPTTQLGNVTIANNSISNVQGLGVWLNAQGSAGWQNVSFSNNQINNTAGTAAYVTASNAILSGNAINGATAGGIYVASSPGASIIGNAVTNVPLSPIVIEAANSPGATLQDNSAVSSGAASPHATITLGSNHLNSSHPATGITIAFDEPVAGFRAGNVVLPPYLSVSPLVSLDGGATWTGTLTASLDIVEPAAQIALTLDNAWTTLSGNTAPISSRASLEVFSVAGQQLNADPAGGSLIGGNGDDTLTGGAGNDRLYGGLGADKLIGGGGDDIFFVDNAGDQVVKAAGSGTASVQVTANWTLTADSAIDYVHVNTATGLTVIGNSRGTYLEGNVGNDALTGGGGADTLSGDGGVDTLAGGGGDDTYFIQNSASQVIEGVGGGIDTVFASVNWTLTAGQEIEVLKAGAGSAGLRLTGNEHAAAIYGGAGNDTLRSGGGNDTLFGGNGNDLLYDDGSASTLDGGSGNDLYYVRNGQTQVLKNSGAGSASVQAYVGWTATAGQYIDYVHVNVAAGLTLAANDLGTWLEGNVGDDTLVGGAGNDYLDGGAGNNRIYGGAGNDTLVGGAGVSTMDGGDGNDTYFVNNSGDQVIEAAGGGIDTVFASASWTMAAGQEIENLRVATGAGGLTLTGNEFSNSLFGGVGNDTLDGGGGDDRLYSGSGVDVLIGGTGNDAFYVNNSADQVIKASGTGSASVQTTVNWTATAGQAIDYVHVNTAAGRAVAANDLGVWLEGNVGNDTLAGGAGNDYIDGGAGDNLIDGGAGDDRLIAGSGVDTFRFSDGWGRDRVFGYKQGTDKLDLSGVSGLTAFGQLGITAPYAGSLLIAFGGDSIQLYGSNLDVSTIARDITL